MNNRREHSQSNKRTSIKNLLLASYLMLNCYEILIPLLCNLEMDRDFPFYCSFLTLLSKFESF